MVIWSGWGFLVVVIVGAGILAGQFIGTKMYGSSQAFEARAIPSL